MSDGLSKHMQARLDKIAEDAKKELDMRENGIVNGNRIVDTPINNTPDMIWAGRYKAPSR
jgi:lambda repressor-like predicted transcriptional regulator